MPDETYQEFTFHNRTSPRPPLRELSLVGQQKVMKVMKWRIAGWADVVLIRVVSQRSSPHPKPPQAMPDACLLSKRYSSHDLRRAWKKGLPCVRVVVVVMRDACERKTGGAFFPRALLDSLRGSSV